MRSTRAVLQLLFVSCLFFMISCSKDKVKLVPDESLTGSWKLSETLADPGNGQGKWRPVSGDPAQNRVVTFKSDGVLAGTAYSEYVKYLVKDSVTLVFFKKNKIEQNYSFKISNGELTMSPAGPILCIEGCGEKFIKVK